MANTDTPGRAGTPAQPGTEDTAATRVAIAASDGDPGEQTRSTLRDGPGGSPPGRAGQRPIQLLAKGAEVGRFTVLEAIGTGAMGAVYEAYDPHLDRRIALKLLAVRGGDRGDTTTEASRTRMMREAKALAKLSHPNVVSIFDVGMWQGDVFLALELVQGATLGDWVREARPGQREILAAYRAAGRGLAAAHAAGLVHRDFKPANAIRAEDGRIRVLDFGLARAEAALEGESAVAELEGSSDGTASGRLDVRFTVAGAVVGTPAYMSPEQHRGEPAVASSDQFAFCVSLYQALYGERPFRGRNRLELRDHVCGGRLRPAPERSEVPRWVREVLVRGLAVDPGLRYPDMESLLAELGRDPAATRRRRAGIGLGVAALAVALALGRVSSGQREEAICSEGEQHVAAVWTPAVAAEVESGFAATGHYLAEASASRFGSLVERYRAEWLGAYAAICQATRVRGEQSGALLDVRMACLMRRRDRLRDLIELARDRVTAEVVENAVKAALMLEAPAICEREAEARVSAPAPAQVAEVEALRRALGQAKTLEHAGRYDTGVELAERVATQAAELAYAPLGAEALRTAASLQERVGRLDDARTSLERALEQASLAGDPRLVAVVQADWMFVVGYRQGQHETVMAQAGLAEATARLAHDELAEGLVARALGAVLLSAADYAAGEAQFSRYLAAARRVYGDRHVVTAGALNNLATTMLGAGAWQRALPVFEEAVAITVESLGAQHPSVAPLYKNVATCHEMAGAYAEAEHVLRKALALEQQALGRDHPDLGLTIYMLGKLLRSAGRGSEATPLLDRAIAIHERHLGPTHAYLIGPLDDLAAIARDAGEWERAAAHAERAHRVALAALGEDHPFTGHTLATLASIAGRRGDVDEARRRYGDALAVYRRAYPADHLEIAETLAASLAFEPTGSARLASAEQAIAIFDANQVMHRGAAALRFLLAEDLIGDPSQRERAIALAEQARGFYQSLEPTPGNAAAIAEIDAWLGGRGP